MAPRVEGIEENNKPRYFTVNLQDSGQFDGSLFDKLARGIDYDVGLESSMLKFIVQGDRMIFFYEGFNHREFYFSLRTNGVGEELQSAGRVSVRHYREDLRRRTIDGWSSTLSDRLPRNISDEYKLKVIAEKLGTHFIVQ